MSYLHVHHINSIIMALFVYLFIYRFIRSLSFRMALSSHMYVCLTHGYTHPNTGNVSSKALRKYFKCFYLCEKYTYTICVCMPCKCKHIWRPKWGIRTLRTGVWHGCVLPDVGIDGAADGLSVRATTPACTSYQDKPHFMPTLTPSVTSPWISYQSSSPSILLVSDLFVSF